MTRLGIRLGLLAAAVGLASCAPAPGPVVVIGLDGLEWNVALPLIREGRMPVLEDMMRRGSFGRLSTRAPAKSPVIWTTVVTGKESGEHGIVDFTRLEADGSRRLFTSRDRTTKALWNILTDHGQESVVLGWWNTFPVEPIDGLMVAQVNALEHLPHRQRIRYGGVARGAPGQVHPLAREEEVLSVVEQVDRDLPGLMAELYPVASATGSPRDALKWDSCRWSLRADEAVRRIALGQLRSRAFPDLLLVYFSTTDIVGHMFWRYHAPGEFRHPPSDARVRLLGGVIEGTYEHFDAVLGELVAEIPRHATVFVVSDHGMRAKHTDADYDARAPGEPERESGGHGGGPPGVIVAAGPLIRQATPLRPIRELGRRDLPRLGDVADLTPTILALRGIPLGRDMTGSILRDLLDPEALEVLPPRYVASHDTPEWRAARRSPAPPRPRQEERLEQLRALGYLDDDGPAE